MEEEDHLAENATLAFLGLAFVAGMVAVFRMKTKRERMLALVISILAGVALGDELSYGERIFEMTLPTVGETKIDGVHDIVQVVWDVKWLVILLSTVAVWQIWKFRTLLRDKLGAAVQVPVWQTLILVGIFTVLATFFDLHIIEFPARHAVEEYFELLAAALLGLSMILLNRHGLKPRISEQHDAIDSEPVNADPTF